MSRKRLAPARMCNHIHLMWSRERWKNFLNLPRVNWSLFAGGVALCIVGLIIAPLPGPGGIFFIAPGLALILKSSMWFKRHYVRIKRWQPRAGRWMDWSLRRESAKRRAAVRKAAESDALLAEDSGNN
jgi:hypothetical protein